MYLGDVCLNLLGISRVRITTIQGATTPMCRSEFLRGRKNVSKIKTTLIVSLNHIAELGNNRPHRRRDGRVIVREVH